MLTSVFAALALASGAVTSPEEVTNLQPIFLAVSGYMAASDIEAKGILKVVTKPVVAQAWCTYKDESGRKSGLSKSNRLALSPGESEITLYFREGDNVWKVIFQPVICTGYSSANECTAYMKGSKSSAEVSSSWTAVTDSEGRSEQISW